jgi:hypothetical protein
MEVLFTFLADRYERGSIMITIKARNHRLSPI